jgi:transcriptional regulator of acetoin/glycerol metabolism
MNRIEPTHFPSSDPGATRDKASSDAGSRELKRWRGFIGKLACEQPLRDVILASWNRSSGAGLERHGPISFRRVTDEQLSAALAENRELVEVARAHLEWISAFMSSVEHVAYLTDRHGVVLYSVGALQDGRSF